jgi:hypothetical protein
LNAKFMIRKGKNTMAAFEPTPMQFTHSSQDRLDFRRKQKRRGAGGWVIFGGLLVVFVGGFLWLVG